MNDTPTDLDKGYVWLYKQIDGKTLAFSSQHASRRYAALEKCLHERRLSMTDYKFYYTFAVVTVVKIDSADRPDVSKISSLDPPIAEVFVEKVMALALPESSESSE